jgi:hypothetical protein
MDNDIDLRVALSDFARTRRIRRIQLLVAAVLLFGLGFLAGASYQYQGPSFIVELPAGAPERETATGTTRT